MKAKMIIMVFLSCSVFFAFCGKKEAEQKAAKMALQNIEKFLGEAQKSSGQ